MTSADEQLKASVEREVLACIGCNDCLLACPIVESRHVTIAELNSAVHLPTIQQPHVASFVGATTDNFLRAFDTASGAKLWEMRLPAGAQATPMSYEAGGRQFVVVAAGGHAKLGTTRGDYVLAFALPR